MKPLQILAAILLFSVNAAFANSLTHPPYTELQWALCEENLAQVLKKMDWTADSTVELQMSYFDSTNLGLFHGKTFLRREIADKKSSTKVKIEMLETSEETEKWMNDHQAKCEVDRYGWQKGLRCSISAHASDHHSLWSKDQQEMLDLFRPGWRNYSLKEWGPFSIQKMKVMQVLVSDKQQEWTLEAARLPVQNAVVLELSSRVPSDEADLIYDQKTKNLRNHGVHLCERQVGKFERIVEIIGH